MMRDQVRHVVIVGGGSAGWITAGLLAARHGGSSADGVTITLVESPDIPIIGVGEGTWPTMRATLQAIGLSERDFLSTCEASFKQGSRFDGWVSGDDEDSYLHPFDPPAPLAPDDLVSAWSSARADQSFASAVSAQAAVCQRALAPRQASMPDYAGALNYGYHLDAVKLAAQLCRHVTGKLGVRHRKAHVRTAETDAEGDIAALVLEGGERLPGDLFVDCTGQRASLIGEVMGADFIDRSGELFNDRALAVQLPVETDDAAIASTTISTAHDAGWIWDIGLPTRRGLGCVYASRFMSTDQARETLAAYVARTSAFKLDDLQVRELGFASGHRAEFWRGNCVAIGLSAGFLEPLEASALVLVELAAGRLSQHLPRDRVAMAVEAKRFNALFRYRWDRIVDFLKLHYVLSRRPGAYWDAHRDVSTQSEWLQDSLTLWAGRAPAPSDFDHLDEVFPAASYLYVLYGMGFAPPPARSVPGAEPSQFTRHLDAIVQRARSLTAALPTNRSLLGAAGLPGQAAAPAAVQGV
jgi:hypothetical protein